MVVLGYSVAPAMVASVLAAFVATLGLLAMLIVPSWAERRQSYFTVFAAGILVTTAIMLFPSVLSVSPHAPFYALGGYLTLYAINIVLRARRQAMLVPLVAIGLHSFIDGFEYGVLFDVGVNVGWTASVGLITHEFAEGVILFALMRGAGATKAVALFSAFLGAALTTPAGTYLASVALPMLDAIWLGHLSAAAAGALLYVGATHLPTHLQSEATIRLMVLYGAGVVLALILSGVHDHDDGHHDAHAIGGGFVDHNHDQDG